MIALTPRGYADSADSAESPADNRLRGTNGIGIVPHNYQPWDVPDEIVEESYETASHMGVDWVRVVVSWYTIEPAPGTYRWEHIDKTVKLAEKHNIKVMMQVTTAPEWATGIDKLSAEEQKRLPGYKDSFAPKPDYYDDYANFLHKVVKRYAPQGVLDYEVWNEPGGVGFWKDSTTNPVVNPESYAELLKQAYPAAHAAHDGVNVIAGGQVVYANQADGSMLNALDFLKRMYAAGAQGHFDSLSHHPYGLGAEQWEWNGWDYMFGDQDTKNSPGESLHSVMEQHGDGHKKIWLTEVGRPTINGVAEEAEQARVYREYLEEWSGNPNLGPIIFYQMQDKKHYGQTDRPDGKLDVEDFFGVVRRDGTWKPAAHAIQEFAEEQADDNEPTPSPSEPEPSAPEVTPTTDQPSPTPDQPTPTPDQPTVTPSDTAPASVEPIAPLPPTGPQEPVTPEPTAPLPPSGPEEPVTPEPTPTVTVLPPVEPSEPGTSERDVALSEQMAVLLPVLWWFVRLMLAHTR